MSIIGLTDRPILRRDGKIRAGYKEENTNKLVNTDHFLLDDAPQLAGILGETVTEIFFTVHSDNAQEFLKSDLRWYNSAQLLCKSMHNAPDEHGRNMGSVAAYSGFGKDVASVQNKPFPGISKARVRNCLYKSCPNYVAGHCTEHMFLDMIVPQYSMGGIFTLDSTSINAILNAHSTFGKAWTRYGGKLAGQIFKMYKKPGEISYQKKDGSTGKRDAQMVFFDMVNFEDYEAKFKNSIRPEDWEALVNLRLRSVLPSTGFMQIAPPEATMQIASTDVPQIGHGDMTQPEETDPDAHLKVIANDPAFVKVANELAVLSGLDVEADAEKIARMRMATVREKTDLKQVLEYMTARVKEAKKKAAQAAPKTQEQPTTPQQPTGEGLY